MCQEKKSKSVLLFLILLIFCPEISWPDSQYPDIIYLKDGAIYKGIITEQQPGETIRLQTMDKQWLTFSVEEVERIEKQKSEEEKIDVEFMDVLFLKSGVIFKGLIIEQVPGDSLTLETLNGSLLSFSMNNIWKIVKEKRIFEKGEEIIKEESRDIKTTRLELQINIARDKGIAEEEGEQEKQKLEEEIQKLKEEMAVLDEEKREEEERDMQETERELLRTLDQIAQIVDGYRREDGEAQAIKTDMQDLIAGISEASIKAQNEYLEEQQRAIEALEERTEIVSTRSAMQEMLEGREWKKTRNELKISEMVELLPPSDRRFLYDTYKRRDQMKGVGLNLIPILSPGSWVQGDIMGALTLNALSIAGIYFIATGLEQRMGSDEMGPFIYYTPNASGYLGIGLVIGSYALGFLEPFRYVNQKNKKLADTLEMSGQPVKRR